MVAKAGTPQLSFNAGEFAPDVWERRDLKSYWAGAAVMVNAEPIPQGGFRLSPRTWFESRVGRSVAAQHSQALGAATGALGAGAQVFSIDMGIERVIAVADLLNLAASAAGAVRVQVLVGAIWTDLTGDVGVSTAARDRRAGRPPGQPLSGRFARVIVSPSQVGTISIASCSLILYAETFGDTARLEPFSISADVAYEAVFAGGHADFFENGVFIGCASLPLSNDQLSAAQMLQRESVMIVFHPDVAPFELRRVGGEWRVATLAFANVPTVDYGGAYSSTVEIWRLTMFWQTVNVGTWTVPGTTFGVRVNGIDASPVAIGGTASAADWANFATSLKAAIEALPDVDNGVTVTVVSSRTGGADIDISFTGGGNPGQQFVVSALTPSSTYAAATIGRLQRGKKGGEPVMSAGRGWPRCGVFYQDRLVFGGFQSRGQALLASRTGEYFDLNTEIEGAAGAILVAIDTDGAERIVRFARGRHLVVFTDLGHYYISDRVISRASPPNIVKSASVGASFRVPPVESETAILFVNAARSQLFAATYSDADQAYVTQPISLLASHVIDGVCGAALLRANEENDADRLFLPRDDGVMVQATLIRNQDVTAFSRWITDGQVLAVSVNSKRDTRMLIRRPVGGGTWLTLERLANDVLLDGAVTVAAPGGVATGLAMHEGRFVWAFADGYLEGPLTVTGGQIKLAQPATNVIVGRWAAPSVKPLPLLRETPGRDVVRRPGRVHTARLTLADTTSLAIGANGRPARDQALVFAGQSVDTPIEPYSGPLAVTGLRGFSMQPSIEITQLRPGRLTVRQVTLEARL